MKIFINLNESVYVKLTDKGIEKMKENHRALYFGNPNIPEFKARNVDKDGYTKFQLHSLMSIFGELMYCGAQPVFENAEIKFEKFNG